MSPGWTGAKCAGSIRPTAARGGTWRASATCTASSRTGALGLTGTQARPRRWPVRNTSGSSSSSTAPSQALPTMPNLNSGSNRRVSSWASRMRSAGEAAAPSKCSSCGSRPRWAAFSVICLPEQPGREGGERGRQGDAGATVGSLPPTPPQPPPQVFPDAVAGSDFPSRKSLWSLILKRTCRAGGPVCLGAALQDGGWSLPSPRLAAPGVPLARPLSHVLHWAPGACPTSAGAHKGQAGSPAARSDSTVLMDR